MINHLIWHTTFWLSDLMECNTVDPRLCVFDIVFWYGIQIIWYGIQLQNHVRSTIFLNSVLKLQLINSIKSTCYILMTMMIYCNQWPLLLLNLYWHLAFKYFQLWRILMNTWQVTILILSCISPNPINHHHQSTNSSIFDKWILWKYILVLTETFEN